MAKRGGSAVGEKAPAANAVVSASVRFGVLHGSERFLQDALLQKLREDLAVVHGADGVDVIRFDGAQGPRILPDVLDECRSFGLMQQYKVIVVDNADLLFKGENDSGAGGEAAQPTPSLPKQRGVPTSQTPREVLESYAEQPSDSATLVLRAATWRPGNLDKKLAALGPRGLVKKCEPINSAEATAWARQRCVKRHACDIQPAAAALLVEAVGPDMGRIDSELEKLALAAGGRGEPITADLVAQMTSITREDDFFAIQQTLLSGDPSAGLGHLRELIDVSRHDPVPIRWAYAELARKLHTVSRAAAQGIPPQSLGAVLKLWGPDARAMGDRLFSLGRTVDGRRAARLLKRVVEADAAAKRSIGNPVRNLERLTLEFAWTVSSRSR